MPAKFKINNEEYRTPDGWDKITFDKFLSYVETVSAKKPACLTLFISEHLKALGELSDDLTEDQKANEGIRLFNVRWGDLSDKDELVCLEFFALEISFWCDIDVDLIKEAMNKEHLCSVFWLLQYEMNPNNAEVDDNFTGFEINGVLYSPPTKHMQGSTVVEFAESAQFQANMSDLDNGLWRSMEDVMVVLCRPKGEKYEYNEVAHNRRKRLFRTTTMDNVINTAFFLLRLNKRLNQDLLIYTMEVELATKQAKTLAKNTDGRA